LLLLNHIKVRAFAAIQQFVNNHRDMKVHWVPALITVIFFVCYSSASSKYEVIMERFEGAFGENEKMMNVDGLRIKKFNRTT
jgi:hypothetical protein